MCQWSVSGGAWHMGACVCQPQCGETLFQAWPLPAQPIAGWRIIWFQNKGKTIHVPTQDAGNIGAFVPPPARKSGSKITGDWRIEKTGSAAYIR